MKDFKEIKLLLSAMVIVGTVFSLGCIIAADEIDEEDVIPEQTLTEISDEDEEFVEVCEDSEVVSAESDNAKANGWDQDPSNGYWYYYVNGKYITGWKEIDGLWYCFDSHGMMLTGLHYDNDLKDYFLFATDGHMLTGWQRYEFDWFYLGTNGRAAKGWTKIDGKYYYFDENETPYMHKYFYKYKNDTYYFGADGSMKTGWVSLDDDWYYLGPTGAAYRGWNLLGGKYYYFDEESYAPVMLSNGVYQLGAGWYGFDKNGVMLTGWYNDDVIKVNGKDYNNGNWYYFRSSGSALVGWQKIGNSWYYFEGKSGCKPVAYVGLRSIKNVWYYFSFDNCAMTTNTWVNLNTVHNTIYYGIKKDFWAYFDENGAAASEWKKINNKTYYFISDSSVPYMHKGLLYLDDGTYYIGDNGVLCTGWFKMDNDYSYAESDGKMFFDGWKTIGGKQYYFKWGNMVTGLMRVDGYLYDFGTDGVCKNPALG